MRTNKKSLITQRRLIDRRLIGWSRISDSVSPPSGWIRAVRGALGMSSRQLARLLGSAHSGVVALEKRESQGKASLEMVQKAAAAMGCKLVYAIVPESPHQTLEDIIDARAREVALKLLTRVEHSMRLENQGSPKKETDEQVDKLASEMKANLDSRLWDFTRPNTGKSGR